MLQCCNAALGAIGAEVVKMGIPVDTVLDETESLQQAVTAIGHRFRAVFDAYPWQPLPNGECPTTA